MVCNVLDSSMSHSISRRRADRERRPTTHSRECPDEFVEPSQPHSDTAIDAALRSVPLPEGLLTRLGMVAYTVSEGSADKLDWLGC
jgi:hypothetical protein